MRKALGIAFALAAIWIGVALWHGALGAARNDDWDAYNLAFRFAAEKRFVPSGWLAMTFVGQALLAWPLVKLFGAQIVPLQLLVAALAAIGAGATFGLLRAFLPARWAFFAVGCLVLGPIYGSLAVSFMTDVPAYTFQMLALLATQRALRDERPNLRWFALALALALFAFSIREYAAPAGLAAALVVIRRATGRPRLGALLLAIGWFAAIVALYAWRQTLPTGVVRELGWLIRGGDTFAAYLRRAGFDLALFVAPAILAISPLALLRATWRSARLVALLALSIVVAVLKIGFGPIAFLGNYLTMQGSYPTTVAGPHDPVVSGWVWFGLIVLSLVALLLLALFVALLLRPALPRLDEPTSLVSTFVVLTAGLHLALLFATWAPMFDRYLITLVPLVAALILKVGLDRALVTRVSRAVGVAALAGAALLGFHYVDMAATLDGARWRLGHKLVARGYPPESIDGGLEWFGLFHPGPVTQSSPRTQSPYWLNFFAHGPVCVSITLPHPRPWLANLVDQQRAQSLLGVEVHLAAIAGPQPCGKLPR